MTYALRAVFDAAKYLSVVSVVTAAMHTLRRALPREPTTRHPTRRREACFLGADSPREALTCTRPLRRSAGHPVTGDAPIDAITTTRGDDLAEDADGAAVARRRSVVDVQRSAWGAADRADDVPVV